MSTIRSLGVFGEPLRRALRQRSLVGRPGITLRLRTGPPAEQRLQLVLRAASVSDEGGSQLAKPMRRGIDFRFLAGHLEVRGLANRVLFMKNCVAIANHPRGTEALIIIDEAHFEGHGGGLVLPPLPLGRMGRRLQEIARLPVQQRSIKIYAQLA